ncbi:MAG: hypothetical protein AAF916_02190 [Planctomycetota bacterium]
MQACRGHAVPGSILLRTGVSRMADESRVKFKCEYCGKRIGVPSKYAGRRVKCPGCDAPITVPEPDLVGAGALNPPAGDAVDQLAALAADSPSAPVSSGLRQIEDPAEASANKQGPKTCPKCGATVNPSAKICVDCGHGFGGLNAKTRVRAQKTASAAGRLGFAVVGGLVTALICGATWAGIEYATTLRLGVFAWLLGIFCGFAIGAIAQQEGPVVGLASVGVSFLGWICAKLMIAVWVIQPQFMGEFDGYLDGSYERESYLIERVRAEGDLSDQEYEDWYLDDLSNSEAEAVQAKLDAWVLENGEPPAHPMLREGMVLDELMEAGEIDEELYDAWMIDGLDAEQYETIDEKVATWVAANGEPDTGDMDEVVDTVGGVFEGIALAISFIAALSLFDLIWVPLMAVSAYKAGAFGVNG